MLVIGCCDGEVGYRAQEGEVEGTVVCGSIFAHQSAAVDAQHHVQTRYGHVVDDVVVGALQERGVDIAEGDQPILGHASREGHGMSLSDAHIEASAWHLLHHDVE